MYAKGTKCEFMLPSMTFLGFTVGSGSVDKESSKVEEVRSWPIPQTIQDMLAFLGLATTGSLYMNLQRLPNLSQTS